MGDGVRIVRNIVNFLMLGENMALTTPGNLQRPQNCAGCGRQHVQSIKRLTCQLQIFTH